LLGLLDRGAQKIWRLDFVRRAGETGISITRSRLSPPVKELTENATLQELDVLCNADVL
jgi:hypothetical protein